MPVGTLSLSGTTLALADTGAPAITVALTSNNYTITDTNGLSGSITGWTISGNTATETNAGAASITAISFNTTNGTFGTATAGITVHSATAVTITDAGSVTIGGAITGSTTGSLNISAAGAINDNANITTTTGTITIAADTAGTGTPGSADFTEASSGATITTTSTSASALSITVNTASGGTSNANIRAIADSGTLTINSNGGSILYSGTDNYSSGITSISEASGSNLATVTPAGTTAAPGATGFYAGESVTIAGTGGVYDGTYTIQSINWSSTAQTAASSFTINTGSATGLGTVTTGTVASPTGVLEAQALGVVGSDNLGTAPTGEVGALHYSFTATGAGSIGTVSRPIQASALASNTVTLTGGSGGDYFVEWSNPLTLSGATATGAGNIVVVAANAGGHNLTVAGNVSTGSGNILLAADDNFAINSGVTIGGSSFSGTVYLACNRDQGNTGTLTDSGTITTSNNSVYNNTGSPLTSTPGAVLLEDYSATGTAAGALTMGNITVGTGGSITATTIPTLGIYDAPAPAGAADIVMGAATNVLTAGTVNLIDQTGRTSSATGGIGATGAANAINVAAANVNITNSGSTSTANASAYVTDSVAGSFSAVVSGNTTGTINVTDTASSGTGLTISGPTSTGGGAITLTDTSGGKIAVAAQLGSSTTGAITINAGTQNVTFTGAQAGLFTSDPVSVTSANAAEFQSGSSLTFNTGTALSASNGVLIDQGATAQWGSGTPTSGTVAPLTVNGTLAPSGSTTGALSLTTSSLNLSSTATLGVNASTSSAYSSIAVSGTATLNASTTLQVNVLGSTLAVGNQLTIVTANGGLTWTGAPSSVTAANNPFYVFSVTVNSSSIVLTVTSAPVYTNLDVTSGVVTFAAAGSQADTLNVSIINTAYTNNQNYYLITDPAEPIVLSQNAINAGWTLTDQNGNSNSNDALGPVAGISSFSISTAGGADVISGITAGSASVSVSGTMSLSVTGPITTTGNVAFAAYPTVDFEANVNAAGITFASSVGTITDGATGTPGTLTGTTLTLAASAGIGTSSAPLLVDATTASVNSGSADSFVQQQSGSVSFSATAAGATNVNLSDIDPNGTLTIGSATSSVGGNINVTAAGSIIVGAAVTSTSGAINLTAADNIVDNANIADGTSGTITITADTTDSISSATTPTDAFTEGPSATITSTNTGANAITITANTQYGGGSGNVSIRKIADSGTLTVDSNNGSVLYAGTDTLDAQQSATYTLFPGSAGNPAITGPAPSLSGSTAGPNGSSGAAPTAGTVNALNYVFTATGNGSIGTAARPINTTTPASNTETLAAGNGGIYFVDWGNPLTLDGASATGGNLEVVAANAGGHNLTVAGNVTDMGSGNIVLAADDNFVVNSGVTIGEAAYSTSFTGDVYLACNRDTGNTETLTMGGTINTSNTTANAVVIEGFHAPISGDTDSGVVSVANVTTGNGLGGGGTITVSTVPYDMTLNGVVGQGDIVAPSTSTVLNAGPTGTVDFIVASMAGLSGTAAVGSSSIPMTVTAGTVSVTANVGTGGGATAYGDAVYVTDTVAGSFNATTGTTSPSGSVNLSDTGGVLTIGGATSTGNNQAINLSTTSGGIVVNGPLGSSTSGAIAVNAGTSGVQITGPQTFYSSDPVTVTAGSAAEITSTGSVALNTGAVLNSTTGVQVDNGGSLTGTGTVNTGSNPLNVDGTLAPTVTTAGLTTHALALQADGTLQVTLDGSSAGQFSEVYVNGTVALGSSTLVIDVNGGFSVGSQFEIINNEGTSPVSGTFINGGSLGAANLAGYAFTVNYAGGDGNDVVLTVTAVPTVDLFDVTSGVGTFYSAPTVSNNLSVTQASGNYFVTDTSDTITLTSNALAAGWQYQGSTPTNTVYGPISSLSSLVLNTEDGNDTINGLTATAPVSLLGTGALAIDGVVTTTGTLTISGYPTVTDAGVADTLTGSSLSITAPSIGTAANPVYSASPTVTVSTTGNAYVSQATGSVSFTATATGAGNLYLGDIDPTGTLKIAGATTTATGNIAIAAAGAIADNANINAGSGTITISADTAGSGSAGFTQATGAALTTTNTTTSAVTINVNTSGGGNGVADVGNATVGSSAGGIYTVNANGGDIIWNETTGQARGTSGVPTNVINAYGFSFTDTGTGGVGDGGVPMQITGPIENTLFSASAGSGGIQVIDFGTEDLQINQAIATGAGAINIETNNAGGHDMLINGTVTTGSGSITLYADDDVVLNGVGAPTFDVATIGSEANALIGGANFSGTVDIEANLDAGNADPVIMMPGSAVFTTNSGANAVLIASYSASGGVSAENSPAGGVQLGNVTVGAGGTITVNGAYGSASGREGNIVQLPGTLLDTSGGSGNTYGTVVLTTRANDTSGDGDATALDAQGNIGVGGTVANPAFFPILVKASTVTATTTGTSLGSTGDIDISDDVPGTFTATTSGNTTGFIILNSTNGSQLTIGGASTGGGTITLNSPAGVVLNAVLGNSTTGAIAVNGPLTGSSNIQLGTGGLTLTQTTGSSFGGAISGAASDAVTYAGPGNLTLTGTSTYAGATAVTGGTLTVNGSLTATSGVTVSGTGVLAGSGTIDAAVTDHGVVSPGGAAGGTALLTVGGLTVNSNGAFTADIDGTTAGTGYDQLAAAGTGTFTLGGTLNVFVTPGASLSTGNTFTILTDGNGVSGTFANAANNATIAAANNPNDVFTVSYTSTSVVLTLATVYTTAELDVINGNEVVYTTPSGLSSVLTVSTASGKFSVKDTSTTITLGAGALALGWTGNGTNTVTGTTSGMTGFLVNLNDGSDTIAGLNDGSANTTIVGTGTLTISGTLATTGSLAIDGFSSVTDNAAVSAASGVTIASPVALTLNGTGSFASSGGNLLVESDLSIGGDGNTLTFSAPANGTVTFNANGNAMTLGTETVSQGALVITNASTLTLNGVLTDAASITVSNVTDLAAGSSENLVTPALSLATSDSIGTPANNVVSSATTVVATSGANGIYMTQDGSATYTASTLLGGALSITDPNAADTLTITSAATTYGGGITLSTAGGITDNGSINSGFGAIAISANTAGGGAGFTQTNGSIVSAKWSASVTITVGGTGNASIDSINADNGTLAVTTNGGSIVYGGNSALTSYQLGVSGDGGSVPSQVLAADSYVFTTANTNNAAGEIGDPSRPLQLDEPNGATLTANAGTGGVAIVAWGTAGSVTLDLVGASATGGNILVVTANGSGHNLTVEGNVTAAGSGSIELAADDTFIVDSGVIIGGSNFAGTVYMGANRDQGNTGTLTEGGTIVTSNSSVYNPTTQTPGAVLLEDYSASGTAAGDLALGGSITVGTGGSITATTIPTLGLYDPAVSAGANDIVTGANVVLTAPGGTVNLIASPGRSTTAVGGIGAAGAPIVVAAANVVATDTLGTSAANASIYITDKVAGTFTAITNSAYAGSINLIDTGGLLTIGGATSTTNTATSGTGGAINLTSTVANGGVTVSAPLGSTPSGAITINAGANPVLFNTSPQTFSSNVTITAGSPAEIAANTTVDLNGGTWTSASGTQVDNGATFGGTGTVASAVSVLAGGAFSPGLPTGTLNVSSFALNATSDFVATLASTSNGGFSEANYTGTANLGGANLQVYVTGNVFVGESFTIINPSGGQLSGVFGSGSGITSIAAVNNPFDVFSVSYSNNAVVLQATQVAATDVLDVVNSNTVNFESLFGVNNVLTTTLAGGNYAITDQAEPIDLTANAIAAGWTGNGTNTVTGPASGITSLNFFTYDGTDTIDGIAAGSASVTITGDTSGTLDFEGNVTTTGNITVSQYTTITDGAASSSTPGTLTGNVLSLTAPAGLGTATEPILTAGQTITATANSGTPGFEGAIYLTQTGTASLTANASGAITATDTSGTFTVAATTTDTNQDDAVTLTSADALVLGGNLNAGNAEIVITADTDGLATAGTASYNQGAYSIITTDPGDNFYNVGPDAAIITVNPNGGLGDAVIGMGSIGSNAGGEITVNANGGNILWSNASNYSTFTGSQTGLTNGGSNTQTLKANDYFLITTGSGGIGTTGRPLQLDNYASAKALNYGDMTLAAGSGGIYVVVWGTDTNDAVTLDSAIATGAGNIRVVAANAGAHNLYVDGPVTTGSGSIELYADDDLILTTSADLPSGQTTTAQIGGSGFSGTVDLEANRDLSNEEVLDMGAGTSIVTSNTSANAVFLLDNSASSGSDTPGDSLIPNGGVVLTSITTGNGGGITVDANNTGGSAGSTDPFGSIVQRSGGLLNAGANGSVTLLAWATDGETNVGDIGASGAPIQVTAGTVTATALGDSAGTAALPTGNIFINASGNSGNTNFVATTSGNSLATVNLTDANGNMTINGATYSGGGAINLTNSATGGNIVLSAPIGNASSGATIITGTVNAVLTNPSATYSSVASNGSATNALNLSTASLIITEGAGFTPAPSATFDVIVNQTGQPIAAPFSNAPEGSILTDNDGNQYQITYLGGASGNDVVLTYLAPVITTQPQNDTVDAGQTATFTAVAFGATVTPSVLWYVNTGSGFTSTGVTTTTLTLTNVTTAMSGYQYEAVFTNTYGTATTNAATLTVNTQPTSVTFTDNGPNPSTSGQAVAFTGYVTPTITGTIPSGETVNIEDASNGNAVVGTTTTTQDSHGTYGYYALSISNLSLGTHNLFAVYVGDSNYASSQSSQQTQTVQAVTSLSLTDNGPNPSTSGQAVSFTVQLSGYTGTITGETVNIEDESNGGATVGSGTLNSSGAAAITISTLSVGSHNLIAVYGGDTLNAGSQSSQVTQVVTNSSPITVSSVNVDAGTAPVITASENGTTVTITTGGVNGFSAGDPVVLSGVSSPNGYDGTYTIATVSPSTNSFTINNFPTSGLGTVSNAGTATDTNLTDSGLLVNGTASSGHSASYNSQRSMVDSIVYTFNQAVTIGSGGFTIAVHTGDSDGGTAPSLSWASPNGGTTWVVTFSGAGVVGNSIANGVYDIKLNNSAVSAVSGGGTLASSETDTFYRLFGDINGDERVNSTDYNAFNPAYNSRSTGSTAAAFVAAFDANGDGRVNSTDYNAFNPDYNVRYTGFTRTI